MELKRAVFSCFKSFENGAIHMKFDHKEERRRMDYIKQLEKKMKKAPPGDIDL